VIPPLAEFLQGYALFTRAHRLPARYDAARVAERLREAVSLAPTPSDEPAALLFAFSKRPRALLDGWAYVARCAENLARAEIGAEIVLEDPVDLDMIRLRVFAGQAGFDDMRAFIAAHLRPLG
jgi:hypothetical protein